MNLVEHPTVQRSGTGNAAATPSDQGCSMRRGCDSCAWTVGQTTPAWSRSAGRSSTTSGSTSSLLRTPGRSSASSVA